jgi:hypothetical protein
MLIVTKRKAAQKRSSQTNALYLDRQIHGEFHHLYEELRNNARGHTSVSWICKVVA